MYVTDYGTGTISLVGIGSGMEMLPVSTTKPAGIALDLPNGRIYCADFSAGSIYRANPDGTARTTLVSGRANPNNVALDVAGGHQYWTEGIQVGNVMRAGLGGGNVTTLVFRGQPGTPSD